MQRHPFVLSSVLALIAAMTGGCSSTEPSFSESRNLANQDALSSAQKQNAAPGLAHQTNGLGADGGVSVAADGGAGVVLCGNAACQCNNGIDDDGDGTVDGADIECTGALDDEEATFATGIPGDNKDPKWQDCFFDGNSGHGDDRCRYPTGCLTGELAQDDAACAITQACLDECFPRTPAGCDCFGCCTIEVKGRDAVDIRLSDTCTADTLGDAEACPVCTKSDACQNEDPPGSDEPAPPGDPEAPPPSPDPEDPPPAPEDPPPAPDPEDPPVIR
jgi:hypothetical protein